MAKVGYARVSTKDQSLDSQIDILKMNGCEKIFSEKVSGRKGKRTELEKCMEYLREGDTLVIYKLDRLGRTTRQLIELSQWLEDNKIELEITSMNIKTDDAMGKMFFTMMSAFAELEANLMSERTRKGLASARARGKKGGRPRISSEKLKKIKYLNDEKQIPPSEIAELVDVSRSTVFRYIKD